MNYDNRAETVIARNINMLVPWYLMASYAYYCLDRPLLSDAAFDQLNRRLALRWRSIKHFHKHLIERGQNFEKVESCFMLAEDYPAIVRGAAQQLLRGKLIEPSPAPPELRPRRKELPREGFFI